MGLYVNNDAVIKAAVVFADRLFEGGESVAVHARQPSSAIKRAAAPAKDVAARAAGPRIVGHARARRCHVFELTHQLPKFCDVRRRSSRRKGGAGAAKACACGSQAFNVPGADRAGERARVGERARSTSRRRSTAAAAAAAAAAARTARTASSSRSRRCATGGRSGCG